MKSPKPVSNASVEGASDSNQASGIPEASPPSQPDPRTLGIAVVSATPPKEFGQGNSGTPVASSPPQPVAGSSGTPAASPTPSEDFRQRNSGRAGKFDPYRVVVRSWWGLGKPFEPSEDFVKRPWHRIDKLIYAEEILNKTAKFSDAECTINYVVEVAYQPTVDFATERFKMHKDLPASIFNDFKPAITEAVRDEVSRMPAMNVLNDTEYIAAQARVAKAIKSIFEARKITCDAYCRFGSPQISWPTLDDDTPQPPPSGQQFYEDVKRQSAEFFRKQDKIKQDEAAAKEIQDDENEKAVATRAATRRTDQEERLRAERKDEIEARTSKDAHAASLRQKDAQNEQAELTYKLTQRIRRMNTESKLREHRILLRQVDEDFLACETALFRQEIERTRAQEETAQVSTEVSNEQAVRFMRARIEAEHMIEIERQRDLLKVLPEVMAKVASAQQSIESLRVVQVNSSGDTGHGLPNGATFQIAQAVTLIREFLTALDDRRP